MNRLTDPMGSPYPVLGLLLPWLFVVLWAVGLVLLARSPGSGQGWQRLATAGLGLLLLHAVANFVWILQFADVLRGRSPLEVGRLVSAFNLAGSLVSLTGFGLLIAAVLNGRRERPGDQVSG